MQGGPLSYGPNKNELLLRRAQGLSDDARLAIVVIDYTSRSSFTNCLPHLEGKEVFGFTKRLADCFPSVGKDSHQPDCMNFSYPWLTIPITEPKMVEDVHIQQPAFGSSNLLPLDLEVACN